MSVLVPADVVISEEETGVSVRVSDGTLTSEVAKSRAVIRWDTGARVEISGNRVSVAFVAVSLAAGACAAGARLVVLMVPC